MEKNHGSKDKRAAPRGKSQKGKKEMGKCEFYVKKHPCSGRIRDDEVTSRLSVEAKSNCYSGYVILAFF